MKKIFCLILSVFTTAAMLAACAKEAVSSSVTHNSPGSSSASEVELATSDAHLLQVRTMLQDTSRIFSVTSLNLTQDSSNRVQIDEALLTGIADLLTTNPSTLVEPPNLGDSYQKTSIQIYDAEVTMEIFLTDPDNGIVPAGQAVLDVQFPSYTETVRQCYAYEKEVLEQITQMVEERIIPNNAVIEGKYVELKSKVESGGFGGIVELPGQRIASIVQVDGEPVQQYLEVLNAETSESEYLVELDTTVVSIELCSYQDYDFRLQTDDGRFIYYNSSQLEQPRTVELPKTLMEKLMAVANDGHLPLFAASFDIDAASDVFAFGNSEDIWFEAGGKAGSLKSSDIPTDQIKDYKRGVPVQFESLRVMNGGKQIFTQVYLPGGPSGEGQDYKAGILIYDIATGEKHWFFGKFDWFNTYFDFSDNKNILGLAMAVAPDFIQQPIRLDLDTLEFSEDLPVFEMMTPNDQTYRFQDYAYNSQTRQRDGSVLVEILLNKETKPLLRITGPDTVYGNNMTYSYVFFNLQSAEGSKLLLMKYR